MMEFDFEKSIARLDEIIAAIEDAEVSLEASMALYKEGVELAAVCSEALRAAEKEVMLLTENDLGMAETRPFSAEGGKDGL